MAYNLVKQFESIARFQGIRAKKKIRAKSSKGLLLLLLLTIVYSYLIYSLLI